MANQQMAEYIRQCQMQGFGIESIKSRLVGQGFNVIEVDESIRESSRAYSPQFQTSGYPPPNQEFSLTSQPFQSPISPRNSQNRPLVITILAILNFIGGGTTILSSMNLFIGGSLLAGIPVLGAILGGVSFVLAIVLLSFGALNLFLGYGLWTLKKWARKVEIVLAILVMLTIVGLPIGGIILYFMLKKSTKEAFGVVG